MSKLTTKILSACLQGLEGRMVEIETDLHANLPSMMIVGLPDKSVEESKERVKSAIRSSNFSFPRGRVVVNLAPADLKKHGPLYDLPIAVSILASQGLFKKIDWPGKMFVGELSLTGDVRPVNGALSVAKLARTLNISELYLPSQNALEASLISGVKIKPVRNLIELVAFLQGLENIQDFKDCGKQLRSPPVIDVDVCDVWGQESAKRALLIAAAGGHNILMIGPPGTGKTMLAKSLASLLPPLSEQEAIEVIEVYSAAGLIKNNFLEISRPIRSPHHTASTVAMVGGGSPMRPGEITLAHHGVLHLDEITEFNRPVLESLREPLEERQITVLRAAGRYKFPANFRLVATMNPCSCGYLGSQKSCRCSPAAVKAYWSKLSGPLLDRIDLFVWLERISFEKLSKPDSKVTFEKLKDQVVLASERQRARNGQTIFLNGQLDSNQLVRFCKIDSQGEKILQQAVNKLNLSTRSYTRVLKVARTIADLESSQDIKASHIGEALQYRLNLDLAQIR